jgi:opacity protein-like surface antigen
MELKKKTNSFYCEETLEASGNLDIFKDGSPSPLMEYRSENGNGKDKLKVTYPSTVNLGLSYLISGWIKVLSSSQISFRNRRDLDGREKDYKPGYQAGLGIEFILNPAVTLSTGYLYNNFGIKPSERSEADPLLNSHQLGGGARLKITENLDLNLGAFYQYFIPATAYSVKFVHVSEPTYSYLKKDFKETRISISIGATYRLFGGEAASAKPKAEETSTPVNIEKNNNDKTVKNSPVKSVKGIKKINRPNTKI